VGTMRKFSVALNFFALRAMIIYFQEQLKQKGYPWNMGTFELWEEKP
jgi:hypothetical protein